LISKDKSGSPAGRVVSVLCGSYPRQVNGWCQWSGRAGNGRRKKPPVGAAAFCSTATCGATR
jgi:hypothetical protein